MADIGYPAENKGITKTGALRTGFYFGSVWASTPTNTSSVVVVEADAPVAFYFALIWSLAFLKYTVIDFTKPYQYNDHR